MKEITKVNSAGKPIPLISEKAHLVAFYKIPWHVREVPPETRWEAYYNVPRFLWTSFELHSRVQNLPRPQLQRYKYSLDTFDSLMKRYCTTTTGEN